MNTVVTTTGRKSKMKSDIARIIYADACLRAVVWYKQVVRQAVREYEILTNELEEAHVSHQSNVEKEAVYICESNMSVFRDNIIDILNERENVQKTYINSLNHLREIGAYMRRLDTTDAEIIARRYEMRQTYQEIGDALYMTAEAVRKRISKALEQW